MDKEEHPTDYGYIAVDTFYDERRIGAYEVKKSLGEGSSAKVKLAVHTGTGQRVAIKIVSRARNIEEFDSQEHRQTRVFREVLVSSLLDHHSIARLLGFYYNEEYFYLVFEYAKGSQLLDLVIEEGRLPEEDARWYFRQILGAVSYFHANNIVHRDLKIENIVVDGDRNVKILDFGLANFFDQKQFLRTFCGSLYFAAPELLKGKKYLGPELDMWSLGCILFVLLHGKVPFDEMSISDLQTKIIGGEYSVDSVSESAKELLAGLINTEPTARWSVGRAIACEWVNEGYETPINEFHTVKSDLVELNSDLMGIFSSACSLCFPNIEATVRKFFAGGSPKARNLLGGTLARPELSLYSLFVASIMSQPNPDLEKAGSYPLARPTDGDFQQKLHLFVDFVNSGDRKRTIDRFYAIAVLDQSEDSAVLPLNTMDLKDEFITQDAQAGPSACPKVRRSFYKGVVRGIKLGNIGSDELLRKVVMNVFLKNNVDFEPRDKHFICSVGPMSDSTRFKVSMFYNPILREFYLCLKVIEGCKERFKNLYRVFEMAGKRVDLGYDCL